MILERGTRLLIAFYFVIILRLLSCENVKIVRDWRRGTNVLVTQLGKFGLGIYFF